MDYKSLLKNWDISFKAVLPEIQLCGSPERCAHRLAIQTEHGRVFVLEKVFPHTLERKKQIAGTVAELHKRGIREIHPYLKGKDGEFLVAQDNDHWQVMPFIDGVDLPRPDFADDAWRGEAFARLLLDLREHSVGLADDSFSIPHYIDSLSRAMKKNNWKRYDQYSSFFSFLEKHFNSLELDQGFCHGDLHPINAIWGKEKINSIIDWEFVGNKPELYDAANLVSCVGIEHPRYLYQGLIPAFTSSLRKSGFGSEDSWNHFPELVIAVRAGWLSEWLRKKDAEMLDLESAYMKILIENREKLRSAWSK